MERSVSVRVELGVGLVGCNEGRSHTVDGGTACTRNQFSLFFCGFAVMAHLDEVGKGAKGAVGFGSEVGIAGRWRRASWP